MIEPIVRWCIGHRVFVTLAAALVLAGGLLSYERLGKLEDPEFTVKQALIFTAYPGASPIQVEQEISDPIETAVQELAELDQVRSVSRAGLSVVTVDIKPRYWADDLPQIWDKLRRKVSDAQRHLPPGALPSVVQDDFGDVFGVLLAVTADGFSYAELEDYAKHLRRELLLVDDVARIDLWGRQKECVYVEVSRSRLAEVGIPMEWVIHTLAKQNMVVDAGSADAGRQRLRMMVTGEFETVEDIAGLLVQGMPVGGGAFETVQDIARVLDQDMPAGGLVRIGDVAEIVRGYITPPDTLMRFNGRKSLGLAVAVAGRGDAIRMGEALRRRIAELTADLPIGIEVETVSFQPEIVREAIGEFTLNLVVAVVIVLVLLLFSVGLRPGLLIGAGLMLTILATFIMMRLLEIDLHRVSLGALIVALGMLVDNAIVVTDGALTRLQSGQDRLRAIVQAVSQTAWPLMGATAIAALAFLPIYLSPGDVGEYTRSLFLVVAISLVASWVLSITVVPLGCHVILRPKAGTRRSNPYGSPFFRAYRALLTKALRHRLATLGAMGILLALSVFGFQFVDRMFFPESVRPQIMVDYWLPEGAGVETVSDDLRHAESFILEQTEVLSVATFVGAGPPRFYLPMQPKKPTAAYGQLILNVRSPGDVETIKNRLTGALAERLPQAELRVRRFPMGPSTEFEIEARFFGPDPAVLREVADEANRIMRQHPMAANVRHDWRQKVKRIDVQYDEAQARSARLTRENVASALKRSFDGIPIGLYREDDKLLPIVVHPPKGERHELQYLGSVPVRPDLGTKSLSLDQAARKIEVRWEDPMIRRRNRRRVITAQCDSHDGNAAGLLDALRPKIDAIALPPGYALEWGGEDESSSEARDNLFGGLPAMAIIMVLIIVALFNGLRKPLLVLILLPLAMIGITAGLLTVGVPFGFLALVGAISMAGMLIKNSVVLLDQIGVEMESGKAPYDAVVDASVSRLRPVMLAAMTTVMGMIPLLFDRFWTSMGVTITFGLTFATVLTLLILPVLYTLFFRILPETSVR